MQSRNLSLLLVLIASMSAFAGTITLNGRSSIIVFIGDAAYSNTVNTTTSNFAVFHVLLEGDCAGFEFGEEYEGRFLADHYCRNWHEAKKADAGVPSYLIMEMAMALPSYCV